MYRKKEYNPSKASLTQLNDMPSVIGRMQTNADQVESNILRAEELLALEGQSKKKGLTLRHQKEIATNLAEAEGLLKDLFMDVDKAKRLQHPQTQEIENDVSNLHDRWFKDCGDYRDIYEQTYDVQLLPRIDWAQIVREKQNKVNTGAYGPSLSDVEKQVAAHNILHKEIEAYKSQLDSSSSASTEDFLVLKRQYSNLLESSLARRRNLASLYDYLQACSKELVYLNEQQERISSRDWSDHITDASGVLMEYERFRNNGLLSHESEVTRLQEEANSLLETKHPATSTIKVHNEAVQDEWQAFLKLCMCQEKHLENAQAYKRYQLDMETLSESLNRISTSTDPDILRNKTNPEIQLLLEGEERAIERNEQRLADLKVLSKTISPLPIRRIYPTRPATVVALCDWTTDQHSVRRGDRFTLKSNRDQENWEVRTSMGETKELPSVILTVAPPDTSSIEKVESLERQLADIKARRATLLASKRTSTVEVIRVVRTENVSSAPSDPRASDLTDRLDKLIADLLRTEKDMLNRLRAPLDRRDPTLDLSSRIKEHERAVLTLKGLEAEKAAIQREMQPLLQKKTLNATANTLSDKLRFASNKIDNLNTLSDLYSKKANASMSLERQIKKVDGKVSGFELQLAEDVVIPDDVNALQTRIQKLQNLRKDVDYAKDDKLKLDKDVEAVELLCNSLQKGFGEYCPDICHQEAEVKRLKNRYTNASNQVQERTSLAQEAANKQQDFQSTVKSLNAFLINMPNNTIHPEDNVVQINNKQNLQMRVVEDIRRKGDDLGRTVTLSSELQRILNEYETTSEKYRGTLHNVEVLNMDKLHASSLAASIQKKEKNIQNLYSEVSAENTHLLNQMDLAKNLNRNEVTYVVERQQVQMQMQQQSTEEVEGLKRDLSEEMSRRIRVESDLDTYRQRMLSLRSRRGVERLEEKEIVQYYRDPKLERDLEILSKSINDETISRSSIHTDIEIISKKVAGLEKEIISIEPKLVTKVFTEFERDPQLDKEATMIREEMRRLREEIKLVESRSVQIRTEITILEQKKPTIKERVVKKEVVRLEKDPVMLRSVQTFRSEISNEELHCKNLNDEIFHIRSQINTLERVIPTVQPKIILKEIKKVEQDPELLTEAKTLRASIEEEIREYQKIVTEIERLRMWFIKVEEQKPKIEVKESIIEIYRIDPETEMELIRLRKVLKESSWRRTELETEINSVNIQLNSVRSEKPKVEWKEVTQEVIREERSPEIVREIERLREQLYRLKTTYEVTLEKVHRLKKERDELKTEKSKVTVTTVTKEFIRYENDPLLEKEAQRLRNDVNEEIRLRRSIEETVFDLQNKYILLERQRPEERVVVQEVVRLQKDSRQILEHERLVKRVDEEVKLRRQLELELQQLRVSVQERETRMSQIDDRQKKILVETELRQIRTRIREIELNPPPLQEKIVIEEVLKVERDPQLEHVCSNLRVEKENELNLITRLERDIRNLKARLEILQKEKSMEKVVYKEVIRVEKDQAVEAERARLREQLSQQRSARRSQEDEIQHVTTKVTRLQTTRTTTSKEETSLTLTRETLLREKNKLMEELRTLETEKSRITVTFQQETKIQSEKVQVQRQKSVRMESDVHRLEKEIMDEKEIIRLRELAIIELQNKLKTEEQTETHTRETNVSTKITILDPETGKDMSPYDAYMEGLIDRNQYLHLQELECNWEELTTTGPGGESSVLRDRKSGKQYSVSTALKEGRLTQFDLQRYKEGKMSISEFALLVAGEKKVSPLNVSRTTFTSPVKSSSTTALSSRPYTNGTTATTTIVTSSGGEELFPISGLLDVTTNSRMSVRSGQTRKLIDPETAQKLLEAQAATGGIVDLNRKDRYSVHKAAQYGLIDTSQLHQLLNAQKAFTGVEDPVSKKRLSVHQAAQKGWIPQDSAQRFMEAQYLTGGMVDPNRPGRISISDSISTDILDQASAKKLQDDSSHVKQLQDPIKKELITYKEAMARCKKDQSTGLLLLPTASSGSVDAPSFSSYTYASHSKV
ncbi:envoplakin [Denticeps clupeoides]|uniref:SH3 domain-containing protein n=1 Tax=Denticeps clupeoides TaxID=299321 RepID=A0AAY4CFH5_9TELE|nr:envoplakin-like [Denticeps clupeoides]